MDDPTVPAPQQPTALRADLAGCWSVIRVCLLIIVLGAAVLWLYQQAQRADANRRAPIVAPVKARYCTLSPSGHFLQVDALDASQSDFYTTTTGERVNMAIPPEVPQSEGLDLWLRDDTLFLYSKWTDVDYQGQLYRAPQNGWLIDVQNHVVTDVLHLDLSERQATLALAQAQIRTYGTRGMLPAPSPDGKAIFYINAKLTDISGNTLNQFPLWSGIEPCSFGWRPDSSGFYFVEHPKTGLIFSTGPGPVRLLLVHPPPGVPPWGWFALGGALALAGLGVWWWRQSRQRRATR
jgi:hypothetical protein